MSQKRIMITGGTGFIGKALSDTLFRNGYEVLVLSRSPAKARNLFHNQVKCVKWDGKTSTGWEEFAENAHAIVNLAGANLAGGLWTPKRKRVILASRLDAGKAIVQAVQHAKNPPRMVVQACGIGYYGSRGDELLDETASIGTGFLSSVARQWEASTRDVTSKGVRHIVIRTGIVLGRGGFLSLAKLPFLFFVGGHFGGGAQWMSWIHLVDQVEAIRFLIEQESAEGAFNLCTPNPVPAKEFFGLLGKTMNRRSWFHLPAALLRLGLGEFARELLLSGQRAVPRRLMDAGYQFKFTELEATFRDILG